MLAVLLGANLTIAICYFTIAALVGQHLWQVRSRGQATLGLATFGIFLTCGLGHGVHVLSYLAHSLAGLANTRVIGGFICIVAGVPAWQTVAGADPARGLTLFASGNASYAMVQLFVDLLTIIPAVAFLGLRRRYRLLAEGEAVILDYQQAIQAQHAIVAERTAALETAEAHACELAEARARAEQARSAAEQTTLALQVSERRFRLLAENARDIIYRYQLGEHPAFEYMSPAVTTVLGRSPDDWYADPQLLAKMMHPDDQPLVAAPRQYSAPNHGSILVIDDEEAVRVVARNMLERCGFTVYAAANGPAGLEMLPELASLHGVVLDLTMPSMGGDTVARAIQKLRPGLPIVLMSGYSAIEVARQYAGLGIASFLQKPFTLDTLEGALRDMVP